MALSNPCWFKKSGTSWNGTVNIYNSCTALCDNKAQTIRVSTNWDLGCYPSNKCHTRCSVIPITSATISGYPSNFHVKSNLDKQNSTNSQLMETKIEWHPLVISNFYKITVSQNNIITKHVVKGSSECKQLAVIFVLPEIPAYILVVGCNEDPIKVPQQVVNDKYNVKYTVKVDDINTYSYQNLGTRRKIDKEINGSVIYEALLIEGLYCKTN